MSYTYNNMDPAFHIHFTPKIQINSVFSWILLAIFLVYVLILLWKYFLYISNFLEYCYYFNRTYLKTKFLEMAFSVVLFFVMGFGFYFKFPADLTSLIQSLTLVSLTLDLIIIILLIISCPVWLGPNSNLTSEGCSILFKILICIIPFMHFYYEIPYFLIGILMGYILYYLKSKRRIAWHRL